MTQKNGEQATLSVAAVRQALPVHLQAAEILVLQETDSTNRVAKDLARSGSVHGTTVIAERQTAGRGRQGRSFYSPAGTGLYMSVILRAAEIPDCQLLTVQAAVAVCRAVEELTELRPGIKWVNDLYLHGRKICGILAEAVSEAGKIEAVVVGIGVNCTTEAFPEELSETAGALHVPGLSRAELAAAILTQLLQYGGENSISAYRERSILLGRQITFLRDGQTVSAEVLDVNDKGNLVVREMETGEVLSLFSGEVSVQGDLSDKE